MRSICCWGAGRSSIKPDSVRGVILAIFHTTPFQQSVSKHREKTTLPSHSFGTRAKNASWCHPNSGRNAPFGLLVRGGRRGRFRPRSAAVLRPGRTGRFQRCAPLWGSACGVLLRHLRGVCHQYMRFFEKSQAMGRVEGLTIYRQSRSPRARPSTSISAVAMLLAKGMLLWSHRREM